VGKFRELFEGSCEKQKQGDLYHFRRIWFSRNIENEGKVKIPRYTWKIAVILNNGDNDISRTRDADVIAIVVPNQESLNSRDWENYLYTVDDIESMLTYDVNNYSDYDLKYDFLSVIPNDIEQVLESRKFDGVIN